MNRKKFQGQEHIDELGLNWDSFKWRNHQPDIGRFFNVDPLSHKYVYNSPYAFSENKVTTNIELEGLETADLPFKQAEPVPEGPSAGSLFTQGAELFETIVSFLFGDGNDGSAQSAANFGAAMEKAPILKEETAKMKGEVEEVVSQVPGLNSAYNIMDAHDSETPGEAVHNLFKAAVNLEGIPMGRPAPEKNVGRSGKQARLKELANDPKVGSADRGWIKNEVRHIQNGNRATIRLPGNSRNSTGPGKVLAHPRKQRAKDGHSYKNAKLQDSDLHKLEHKYEGY